MRNNVLEKNCSRQEPENQKKNANIHSFVLEAAKPQQKNHLTPGLANVNKFKYMGLGMRAQFNMVTWCII